MRSSTELILDTVIGFLILALCLGNLLNLIGSLMRETTYGFGTLNEKSGGDVYYTVDTGPFAGFTQAQYYMLPIVDSESERTTYKLDSDETYAYSEYAGDNLSNLYHKILPVLSNTENSGGLDEPHFYLEMDKSGTLRFRKEVG